MDIEDLSVGVHSRNKSEVSSVKARFKPKAQIPVGDLRVASYIPEKYRIFVQTWGCAHNTSDSEYMAGLLAKYGYQVVLAGSQWPEAVETFHPTPTYSQNNCDHQESIECENAKLCRADVKYKDIIARQEADVWLLNSCTVKGPAEAHFRNAVLEGIKLGKYVVVAGCVPQGNPGVNYLKGVSVIGVQQIDRVVEVVEETIQGHVVRFLDKKWCTTSDVSKNASLGLRRLGGAALDLPKIRRNPLIEILAISTGCLNACTYCKTKHARGVLASYPLDQLLQRAKEAFAEGVKELWLTSEDLGAYGRDLDRSTSTFLCPALDPKWPGHLTLADLLAGLVPLIPPGCLLRLGMTNPPYILDQLEEIADVLSHPRVYSFIHIPVQSVVHYIYEQFKGKFDSLYSIYRWHTKNDYRKFTISTQEL